MIFVVLLEPSFYYTLYLKMYVEYYNCKCDIHMNFASVIGDIGALDLYSCGSEFSSSPFCSLDLFLVAPSLTPRFRFAKSQLACLCPKYHKLSIRILTSNNQGHHW